MFSDEETEAWAASQVSARLPWPGGGAGVDAGLRLSLCPRKGGFEGRGKASVVFTALRLSPGDPGVAQRQAQFMSRVLARAQRCHPDTRTSCRTSSRGPSLSGKDWVSGGAGVGTHGDRASRLR